MLIDERLRAIAEALPEDGRVSFIRTDLLNMIASAETAPSHPTKPVAVDLTVAEVAELLHRAPGTVRGWCATGELPGAYRFRGREWRIPAAAMEALQQGQGEEHTAQRNSARYAQSAPEADWGTWRSVKSTSANRRGYRRQVPAA